MKMVKKIIFIVFMTASAIFLFGSCAYFGTRLVHFYLLENGKVTPKDINLNKLLTSNLVTEGDGLYGKNGEYYFYGKELDNYILYSNRLFRVLSIDRMGNIKMVSNESLTSIYNGEKNSYLEKWINDYYETLNKEYIIETKYCVDTFDTELTCENEESNVITLLTMNDYEKVGNVDSFLNDGEYYWLSTLNENGQSWYINNEGYTTLLNTKASLGVKPVITIMANLNITSGNGTKDFPYIVEDTTVDTLNKAYVGSYVSFSDRLWRISKKEDNIILVLDELVEEKNYSIDENRFDIGANNTLANYLNNEFYNTLETDKLIKNDWYNGLYEDDYEKVKDSTVNSYVGLNSVGDIFFTNENIYTITPTGNATRAIYTTNGNRLGISNINEKHLYMPLIAISTDTLVIEGNGTISSPYIIK